MVAKRDLWHPPIFVTIRDRQSPMYAESLDGTPVAARTPRESGDAEERNVGSRVRLSDSLFAALAFAQLGRLRTRTHE
jgi:hypothetical protein